MISRVIRLFLLSIVATMGSFSHAETEYSPANAQEWYSGNLTNSNPTALCKAIGKANGYSKADLLVFASPYFCVLSTTGATYTGVSQRMVCPSGFERNQSLPPEHPQACYREVPDEPEPCEDEEGQEFTAPYYLGDVSSSGDSSGTTSPPQFLCIAQCRAVMTSSGDCYSRAYLASSDKFGKSAVFCEATYTVINQTCTASDDPSNPPPPDAPTDPDNPDTPLPSAPTPAPMGGMDGQSGTSDDNQAPAKDPNAPSCLPGTYAVQSGNTYVCNSIDNPHPRPDEEGCPAGSQVGTVTVNGVVVPTCMKGGSSKPSSNSPGSGTAGATGADGAGGTSGNATAGSVGSTADTGGSVGGGGGTQSQGVGTSEIGVVCDVQPVCEGDPLLCAIQIQEWKSSCELQKSIASPLPEEELEGWKQVGTMDIDSSEIDGTTDRASQLLGQFSQRLGFSTAGCPGDFNISVLGRSVTIAISEICTLLRLMKMLLWLGAYLFSIRVLWSVIL